MKKNMSTSDRYVRLIITVGIGALILLNVLKGPAAIVLGIIAFVFLLTTLTGFCPLYSIFGISTKK